MDEGTEKEGDSAEWSNKTRKRTTLNFANANFPPIPGRHQRQQQQSCAVHLEIYDSRFPFVSLQLGNDENKLKRRRGARKEMKASSSEGKFLRANPLNFNLH